MKTKLTLLILCLFFATGMAVTLEDCITAAEKNYAESENIEKYDEINKLAEQSIKSSYLPQLSVLGMYKQNSESTEMALSGLPFDVEFPEQSKDSYFMSLQLQQVIYDGGITARKQKLSDMQNKLMQNNIESKILQRKLEVLGLYYGILITREQEAILILHKESLASELHKVNSGVTAGLLDKSAEYMIEEQLWQLAEELFEVREITAQYLDKLSLITGLELSEKDGFEADINVTSYPSVYYRAELKNYLLQTKMEEVQSELSGSGLLPSLQFSASASYGNPGYNIFEDEAHDYYSASMNFNWKLWDWNKRNHTIREHTLRGEVKKRELDSFREKIDIQVIECNSEIDKLTESLRILDERQALLNLITANYASKLEQGMISSSEYLQQFNKLKSCELEQAARELQKEFISIKKLFIMGGEL